MKKFFATRHSYTLTFTRVTAGLAMLPYGIQKVQGFEGTIGFLTGMGVPYAIVLLVILGETVGAASLILGFATRFCAASLSIIMIGAIYSMFGSGFMTGYATPLLFLLLFLPLVVNGAGAWSVDGAIASKLK